MSDRFRWGLEGSPSDPRLDPDPFGRLILAAIVATWLVFAALVATGRTAEKDTRATLWIYTDPRFCPPCRILDADIKAGKLAEFRIVTLPVPEDADIPCIYFRDSRGRWAEPFVGWSKGEAKAFKAFYKARIK